MEHDSLNPSERRYQKNRRAILDAAMKLIARHGMDALSMRALADEVDYSPSALYKYFDDKDKILEALREESWQMMAEFDAEHATTPQNAIEDLINGGKRIYGFARANPNHYQLMISSFSPQKLSLEDLKNNAGFQGLFQGIAGAVAAGDMHLPPGFDVEILAFFCWFSIHGAAMIRLTMMNDASEDFDALVDRMGVALAKLLNPPADLG